MISDDNQVTEVTKMLIESINDEFEEIILIGVKEGVMNVRALNMTRMYLLGLIEATKYDVLTKTLITEKVMIK